jgi:hypothetical protein
MNSAKAGARSANKLPAQLDRTLSEAGSLRSSR